MARGRRAVGVAGLLLAVCFGVLALSQAAAESEESAAADSNVIVLTEENFEHLTQASTGATTGNWLVKFYAPWCGHCKRLAPIYEEVATELKGVVSVAHVDVTQHPELGNRFNVRGYPTVLYFVQGKMYEYNGPRKVEAFVEFAKEGYKKESSKPVPAPPSFVTTVKRHLELVVQDFESLVNTKKNVLAVTFSFGTLFGLLLGCCCCGGSRATCHDKGKKKKE